MNFKKNSIGLALFLGLLAACGGPDLSEDDQLIDYQDAEELELATVEQAMTAQATPTLSYGITTASVKGNCNRTSSGQACLVPVTKNVKWCVDTSPGAVGAADYVKVSNAMALAISNAMTKMGFTFTHVADGVNCKTNLGSGNLNVMISVSTANLCGNQSGANIENYVCSNPTLGGLLTESLPGSYRQMLGGVIIVDWNDIVFEVGDAGHQKVLYHGLGHNMLGLMGIGSQTAASNLLSRRAVTPVSNTLGTSSSENCRALNYNVSSTSTFQLHSTLGCVEGP